MAQIKPNQHNWGLIAQEHNPYKEYSYCERCGKYRDDSGNILTKTQFKRIAQLHRLFQPDSNVRLVFENPNFKSLV
ncbi:MAG: hypothetical protein WC554_11820 [Clostridia bacterium]|jgi:hypothetical protein